ncbi:Reverse transcriptase zinc-binding domain - like 6 [Theobroma cacao]|nr:Reverse transcriptase zinc-binding domain - like 6 [Theobroma cacao]
MHWAEWAKISFPCAEGGLGIRKLEDICTAFTLKLWWRFETGNSLWTQFLRTKYCLGRIPHHIQPKLHDSHIWKRMISGREMALQNIRWKIGKGDLFFWHDCWMGDKPLAASFPEVQNDMSHVYHFYNGDTWDVDKLKSFLPTVLVEEILQVPFDKSREDVAYWTLTSNGDFSTRSAWEMIRQRQTSNALCSFIWHRSIPLSISFFLWKTLHNWIPVELRMKEKGMMQSTGTQGCIQIESYGEP